jgi:hypothetical protein
MALTFFSYSALFYLYNCAAAPFAGEFGLGSQSNDLIDVKIAQTSYTGFHSLSNTIFNNILTI